MQLRLSLQDSGRDFWVQVRRKHRGFGQRGHHAGGLLLRNVRENDTKARHLRVGSVQGGRQLRRQQQQ